MLDINGVRIEEGDTVAFPGPYGQNLVLGTATRVWQRIYYQQKVWCVRVRMHTPEHTGRTERDCFGNRAYYGTPTEVADTPVKRIVITTKGVDNSVE